MKFVGIIASLGLMGVAADGTCKHSRFTCLLHRLAPRPTSAEDREASHYLPRVAPCRPLIVGDKFDRSIIFLIELGSTSMSGSSSLPRFTRFFDQEKFHLMFPDAVSLYNFYGLVNAASKYRAFANTGNDDNDKRELAAFLSQTAHESDSFKAAQEFAWNTYSVLQYCDSTTPKCARHYIDMEPLGSSSCNA